MGPVLDNEGLLALHIDEGEQTSRWPYNYWSFHFGDILYQSVKKLRLS